MLGELVRTTAGKWITHPPTRCPNGHILAASRPTAKVLYEVSMGAYRSELRAPMSVCSARAAISAFIRAMISFRAR